VAFLRLLFAPIVLVHEAPVLAALPALAFAAMAWAARSSPRTAPAFLWPAVTAAMWAASGFYEAHMREWERTVTAPIRVDLLALWPILLAASLVATVAFVRGRLRPSP
jgi:hypothetical protein